MSHRLIVAFSVLTLFAGLSAGSAKADSITTTTVDNFTFIPTSGPTYAWSIAVPVIVTIPQPNNSFVVNDISYTADGAPATADFVFYSASKGGGFILANTPTTYLISEYGPALYTGPETAPTFTLGTFTLTDALGTPNGTIDISEVTSTATPEPSTLLLTGLGIVGLFWVARKRRYTAPA